MSSPILYPINKFFGRIGLIALVIAPVAGCYLPSGGALHEGIGYREARFSEITAVREYRACRDEGIALDKQGRTTGDGSKYLASAKMLESCEANLGNIEASLAIDERVRAYAIATQNRFKAGDISGTRSNLDKFKTAFPTKDLYLADGSSFIETMEILIGLRNKEELVEVTMLNVSDELKKELRRMSYWKRH